MNKKQLAITVKLEANEAKGMGDGKRTEMEME